MFLQLGAWESWKGGWRGREDPVSRAMWANVCPLAFAVSEEK